MKRYFTILMAAALTACVETSTPTDPPAAPVASRHAANATIVGSMPIPPCNAGLVGFPTHGTPVVDPVWSCVPPPVACPADTVYVSRDFFGVRLDWCSPTPAWLAPAPEPTPAPTPTPTLPAPVLWTAPTQ